MQPEEHPLAEQTSTPAKTTRRRPGRNEQVSPRLIALLRNPTVSNILTDLPENQCAFASHDDLKAIRGIFFSLVLCVLLWAGAIGIAWLILH